MLNDILKISRIKELEKEEQETINGASLPCYACFCYLNTNPRCCCVN